MTDTKTTEAPDVPVPPKKPCPTAAELAALKADRQKEQLAIARLMG